MGRRKGAVNQSEFTVYFYSNHNPFASPDDEFSVIVLANSVVSACTQVIQDFDPVRISRVYKNISVPSLEMGG